MNSENINTPGPLIGSGRVALVLEYNGAKYHGWQAQKSGVPTVQGYLHQALSTVANHPVEVVCAGRTDAGVHASHQVVHFETTATRPRRSWVMGANANLPSNISVRWAGQVTELFHARFSAVSRRYRYVIYNNPIRPAIQQQELTWNYRPLDHEGMHIAAQHLVGKHDFSSYRASECQAKSPVRDIEYLNVRRFGDFVVLDIKANAFLHHMVRNVAGVLMEIGCHKRDTDWSLDVLNAKNRAAGGVTASPYGLYLVDVTYPEYQIPVFEPGPAFLKPYYSLL